MAAPFNYNVAKNRIKEMISAGAFRDLLRYIQRCNLKFWAAVKPHDLAEIMLVATCMKDVLALSYNEIIDALSAKLTVFPKALQHNVRLCRCQCRNWARQYIRRGTAAEWRRAANRANLPIWLKNVRLWMDSTDIRICKKRNLRGPKSDAWSAKLKAPGRRFSLVSDADGVIRKVWSGVSPKKYDSEFVMDKKDSLEDDFAGATIIGDNHYWQASKKMDDTTFLACAGKSTTVQEARAARFAQTKEELKARRPEAQEARARVETNFSSIKRCFRSLRGEQYLPWRESMKQLDYTFTWACAVHNFKKLRVVADE